MALDTALARDILQVLDFSTLFIDVLGWSQPLDRSAVHARTKGNKGIAYTRRAIAELAGVTVYEIFTDKGIPSADERVAIQKDVSSVCYENILIFLDSQRTQSLWHWTKRDKGKVQHRSHLYVKGQPGDLFLSKLSALVVDISELDPDGHIPIVEVADRLKAALDIQGVTKRFFNAFAEVHEQFVQQISGITNDHDRRWYASVILNRLMFIWFLQKKLLLDGGNANYLPDLLDASSTSKKGRFFSHTLRDLFFEGLAKSVDKRNCVGSVPLGDIPYLNGGLFLPHSIETRIEGANLFSNPFTTIKIPDAAFSEVFRVFSTYSWSLDDTPGGQDNEINPDVLGYIFEKYINQKEFGAYYTPPEITEYLCEQTIHQLVLDAANQAATTSPIPAHNGRHKGTPPRRFETMSDLLLHADGPTCQRLLMQDIPRLSLLDPACGSGAFLLAALKTLLSITTGLIGRCEAIGEQTVLQWVQAEQKKHKAPLAYWLKKKIVTDNLYGVDIMEEAVEIAKLRLFLALVASVRSRDQLEPLPNIEFNLMAGNSLIGLIHVDPAQYDDHTGAGALGNVGAQGRMNLVHQPGVGELGFTVESKVAPDKKERVAAFLAQKRGEKYKELLREKNYLVDLYKKAGDSSSGTMPRELRDITILRERIEEARRTARSILNALLLEQFQGLGIEFEQATWYAAKGKEGKPIKRPLKIEDIEALSPFHWAYEFDEIIVQRGGFDAIITNPPWEIFKPNSKEFFRRYSDHITLKKMRIEDFEKAKQKLLQDPEIRAAWLEYLSGFSHLSRWFNESPQFPNQTVKVNGRKVASDINLYKLFLEQTVHLLRDGGRTGIVIPSGIYTDLGTMQLRKMLFDTCRITGLFGFDNRRKIFEGVTNTFKFVVLSFQRGGYTEEFPAAFMRHDVADLNSFPSKDDIRLSVNLIKRFSPDSFSIMEFKSPLDIKIADKMFRYPLLGEKIEGAWYVNLTNEFHMTNDSDIFHSSPAKGRIPLYEGKMIWQFQHGYAQPRYWVDEKAGRKRILGSESDTGQTLGYQCYRLAYRAIAGNTDRRSFIAAILPQYVFCGHSLALEDARSSSLSLRSRIVVVSLFNSFCCDWLIRQMTTKNISFFFVYKLPIPRLTSKDASFRPLVERAVRLIGTSPEFDELLQDVFGPKATHKTHGVSEPKERQTIRAEIDALVARIYDLTEEEFAHILSTFPLVSDDVKSQTLNTYRNLLRNGGP